MTPPRMQAAILPGGRLHLHDGPIDLIISADGASDAVRAAFAAATRRFATVLDELCEELTLLRDPMSCDAPMPAGVVARRMDIAVRPLSRETFITRMAAVAGSVADQILATMVSVAPLARAWVNNGGDIAVHLSEGTVFDVAMAAGLGVTSELAMIGTTRITYSDPVRGIATSGFGGRSFSLGIADAVTILSRDAASADAAATLVANAVDLPGHPAIARAPANAFDPESDLGARRVTRAVGPLSQDEITTALDAGVQEAERLREKGHVVAAALTLRGTARTVGNIGQRASDDQGKFTYRSRLS